jgi:hypothetical protein
MSDPLTPPRNGIPTWVKSWEGVVVLGCAGLIALVLLFYVEENRHGAHVWAQTKAELEAKGDRFDKSSFIPESIPDDQNFGALPFFEEVPDARYPQAKRLTIANTLADVVDHLTYAGNTTPAPGDLPSLGNWQKGETANPAEIQKRLDAFLTAHKPKASIAPKSTPADIFALICPAMGELRQANETHPLCRFNRDYSSESPWNMSYGPVTDQIKIAKVLAYDAKLGLLSHQTDLALGDFRVAWKINSGLRREPALFAGLVGIGLVAIQLGVLDESIAEHDWNDAQLAAIDGDLGGMDFLAQSQSCLRSELAFVTLPVIDYGSTHRTMWIKLTGGYDDADDPISTCELWCVQTGLIVGPRGIFDTMKARTANQIHEAVAAIDPALHRVYPDREDKLRIAAGESPLLAALTDPVIPLLGSIKNFSYLQVHVDEARIACRLERYRLAHGKYPFTLAELGAGYGQLPCDIMSGDPYHYRLNPDGTYLIYSVGWNQKDDHGDAGPHRTSDSPDWIWTSYPSMK